MTPKSIYNGMKSNRGESFSVDAITFSASTKAMFHVNEYFGAL